MGRSGHRRDGGWRSEGFVYGYAFKILCRQEGGPLPNDALYPMDSDYLTAVSEEQTRLGVDARRTVESILYRGAPLPIPRADDFPLIGYLRADEIGPALGEHRRTPGAAAAAVRPALDQFTGWLATCDAARRSLVCFSC